MTRKLILACGIMTVTAIAAADGPAAIDTFNYAVGTQTIGPSYQFTRETRLVETAEAIRAMGSNAIKFAMGRSYFEKHYGNVPARNPAIRSLTELARDEPSHRRVFDLPLAYYVLWTYTFTGGGWEGPCDEAAQRREYKELYEFVRYLLATYHGTGKTFFLGHWEGDWILRGSGNTDDDGRVTPERIQAIVDRLNVRQRAIDDAKHDRRESDVRVWQYAEVNLVRLAMAGRRTITNDVLPKTDVDYVSYSAYDTEAKPEQMQAALDYIAAKLRPKPGLAGRRVFIGEYGFPRAHHSPAEQDRLSRQVMRTALDWGCPMVLYWEMYNNEVGPDGRQRGFWLIDDQGVKQPVYETHERLYAWARRYKADFARTAGRPPTFDEYRRAAVAYLDGRKE